MRVTHVITDLRTGGAEVMLPRLVTRLQTAGIDNTVVSLGAVNAAFESMEGQGITLHQLDMTANVPSPIAFIRLRRLLVTSRPDVVHTWMYHADLMGGLAAHIPSRVAPVLWGLQCTPSMSDPFKLVTRAIIRANARLSTLVPARIACCAHAAKAAHEALGYPGGKMVVVSNACDTNMFHPDPAARTSVRQELGLPDETPLVGLMARFHPQKDHHTFVRAAAEVMRRSPSVHFVLAGRNVDGRNPALRTWIAATHAAERFHLLGDRDDMPRLMAACDIVSSSSAYGEGCPLVLGEAMSCGVPCVTTDVGDSALVVGQTGKVVAPGHAGALAAALASILALSRSERGRLGELARHRVMTRYPLAGFVEQHLALYRELCQPIREGRG